MTSRSTIDDFDESEFEYGIDGPYQEEAEDDVDAGDAEAGDAGEPRPKSAVNISSIEVGVGGVSVGNELDTHGGSNPQDIPGNEYWADYWSQESTPNNDDQQSKLPGASQTKGLVPTGGTGTLHKAIMSRRKRRRKCLGLVLFVVMVGVIAIVMVMRYGGGSNGSKPKPTQPTEKPNKEVTTMNVLTTLLAMTDNS